MSSYIPVIGLEIHAELLTKSKYSVLVVQNSAAARTPVAAQFVQVCREHCQSSTRPLYSML